MSNPHRSCFLHLHRVTSVGLFSGLHVFLTAFKVRGWNGWMNISWWWWGLLHLWCLLLGRYFGVAATGGVTTTLTTSRCTPRTLAFGKPILSPPMWVTIRVTCHCKSYRTHVKCHMSKRTSREYLGTSHTCHQEKSHDHFVHVARHKNMSPDMPRVLRDWSYKHLVPFHIVKGRHITSLGHSMSFVRKYATLGQVKSCD